MTITFKQLQVLHAVVTAGSVSKAVRFLGLSQPAISEHLARLEKEIGAQLIIRRHGGVVSLTPAGEYWSSKSQEMLQRFDEVYTDYKARFASNSLILRIGITPTLRGRFIARAARIASEQPEFVRFDVRYGITSRVLVEQLELHQLNCAVVNGDAIANERGAYAVSDVFTDPIALVVPVSVSDDDLSRAIRGHEPPQGALERYVEVEASPRLRSRAEHWYRANLRGSRAMFSSTNYAAAVDLCAEGLATTHCPLSLIPNLADATLKRIRFFRLPDITRNVVLAMPKHLMTLSPYAKFYRQIEEFCRTEYSSEMRVDDLRELPLSGDAIASPPAARAALG